MRSFSIIVPLLLAYSITQAQSPGVDSFLLKAFFQGRAKNCASVALIKSAMFKYGFNNVFKWQNIDNGYQVNLKDGTHLSLTKDEFDKSRQSCKFDTSESAVVLGKLKDSVLFYAYLSYACIAKNVETNGYYGCVNAQGDAIKFSSNKNFQSALKFITRKSFCTDKCYKLLGLKIEADSIYNYHLGSENFKAGTILYSQTHAACALENRIDIYGNWVQIDSHLVKKYEFQWFIILD